MWNTALLGWQVQLSSASNVKFSTTSRPRDPGRFGDLGRCPRCCRPQVQVSQDRSVFKAFCCFIRSWGHHELHSCCQSHHSQCEICGRQLLDINRSNWSRFEISSWRNALTPRNALPALPVISAALKARLYLVFLAEALLSPSMLPAEPPACTDLGEED